MRSGGHANAALVLPKDVDLTGGTVGARSGGSGGAIPAVPGKSVATPLSGGRNLIGGSQPRGVTDNNVARVRQAGEWPIAATAMRAGGTGSGGNAPRAHHPGSSAQQSGVAQGGTAMRAGGAGGGSRLVPVVSSGAGLGRADQQGDVAVAMALGGGAALMRDELARLDLVAEVPPAPLQSEGGTTEGFADFDLHAQSRLWP